MRAAWCWSARHMPAKLAGVVRSKRVRCCWFAAQSRVSRGRADAHFRPAGVGIRHPCEASRSGRRRPWIHESVDPDAEPHGIISPEATNLPLAGSSRPLSPLREEPCITGRHTGHTREGGGRHDASLADRILAARAGAGWLYRGASFSRRRRRPSLSSRTPRPSWSLSPQASRPLGSGPAERRGLARASELGRIAMTPQ